MRRAIPVVSTLLVALAIAAMIALGVWQLQRLKEKEALLALYAANIARPPAPLAAIVPIDDRALFRETNAMCLAVTGWRVAAGHGVSGQTGWSHIATCRTGAEGPGFAVDMGVSQSPDAPRGWTGGVVRGRLASGPGGAPLIARLLETPAPQTPLIVAEVAAPGLVPTAPPDPAGIPNNHFAYAVQWFLFAAVAAIVYAVALVRRARSVAPPPPPR